MRWFGRIQQHVALPAFGKNFGIAFQLVDDAMDYDAPAELLGKPQGTDFKEGHVTLPLLYLYKQADRALKREIESFIHNDKLTNKDLEYILERMREVRALEYTLSKAQTYMDEAKKTLATHPFPSPEIQNLMVILADHIMTRYKPSRPSLTPIT